MKKVILFDFWGTLVENGVWSPIKQVRNMLQIRLPFPEYVVRMERAMMTEKFSSLKEAFESVCKEFSIEPNKERIEALVGMWNSSWMLAQPYQEVKDTLTKLKEKYSLVLISNTDSFSIENVLDKFELRDFFDTIFLSYKVGMIKTDSNFLKHEIIELAHNVSVKFIDNSDLFTENEWNELYKLSENTFVEESDSLKQAGAGAGLTDND
ncbi:HAD family hydrolase [Candidatus Woesearchaeota archaeon]|nr:HAD family hydrolase [Candidatus Woesearchaeota archaeon]